MEKKHTNKINRREFLKRLGGGAAAVSAATLTGCNPKDKAVPDSGSPLGDIPKGKMTYRTNPKTNEKVSILGYGCMRWPT